MALVYSVALFYFQAIILFRADVELNIGYAGLVSGIRLY